MADATAPVHAPDDQTPAASVDRRRIAPWSDRAPFVLMMVVTFGLFGLLVMMNFHPVPDASKDLMNIMLGAIGTGWVAGINYFFGSSASARTKDTAIATLAAKSPAAGSLQPGS